MCSIIVKLFFVSLINLFCLFPPMAAQEKGIGMIIFRKFKNENNLNVQYLIFQTAYITQEDQWLNFYIQVKPGDDEEVAAFRELERRTGIPKSDLKVISGFSRTLTHLTKKKKFARSKITNYFLVEMVQVDREIVLKTSYKNYMWASLTESRSQFGYPQQYQIIKSADDFLKKYKMIPKDDEDDFQEPTDEEEQDEGNQGVQM